MTDEYTKGLEQQLDEVQTKLAAAQGLLAKRRKKKEDIDPTNTEIKRWKLKCERTQEYLDNANREIVRLKGEYSKVRFLGFEWTRKIN